MADEQMSQFTAGGVPLATDYVGGFAGASAGVAGGNRKTSFANIATYIKTAISSASIASGVVARDASQNAFANNFLSNYTTTATAAGTTTLTVASSKIQYFTGSTTQTVVLPVTSTLVLGFPFVVVNNSSGIVTVQSSGANSVLAMTPNSMAIFTVILTSGTSAASWDVKYGGFSSITGTGAAVLATSPTLTTPVIGTATFTSLVAGAAANTLVLKQGANGKTGTVTLNGVTPVTVTNSSITANSHIFFTLDTVGGTVGAYPAIQTITPTTGFDVAGTALDTSTYKYSILESAA